MIEERLLELADAIELYLSLEYSIQTGSVVKYHKDVIAADPTADLVILKEDIWNRISEISQEIQRAI